MWYEQIVSFLLDKITKEQRKDAELFCKKFFEQINPIVFMEENDPHLQFILSLIEKLFLKFDNKKEGSVSLEEFARYLFGLTVICAKLEFDTAVWVNEFAHLLENSSITDALNIGQMLEKHQEELKSGQRVFKLREDELEPNLATKCQILVIRDLENKVFSELGGQLGIEFFNLQSIFSRIKSWPSMSMFFAEAAASLTDIESEFSLFVMGTYQFATEKQVSFNAKDYECYFMCSLQAIFGLINEYKDDLTKSDCALKIRLLYTQLVLASFAYFLEPNCFSYLRFKTTALDGLKSFKREGPIDNRMNGLSNRLFFAILGLGQYQLTLGGDKYPTTEDEHNFVLELNDFYASCPKDCLVSAELLQKLSAIWADYLINKNLINYFIFKIMALELINTARNRNSGLRNIDKLEFALLGMELEYRYPLRRCLLQVEAKFYNYHLFLARKIAETRLRGGAEVSQKDLGLLENLSYELGSAFNGYLSSDRESSDFDWLIEQLDTAYEEAKNNLEVDWSIEFENLDSHITDLALVCSNPASCSTPVFTKEEQQFLEQKEVFIAVCLNYIKCDEVCYLPGAGHIDAIASQLSTSVAIYFEFKTLANFQTLKVILTALIERYSPSLSGGFGAELERLRLTLNALNAPETVYKNDLNQEIFFFNKAPESDDLEQSIGLESAEI